MFDAPTPDLPSLPQFAPVSLVGKKARPITLSGHGSSLRSFNLITKEEIADRTYALCEQVLNPILAGSDATLIPILNGAINFCSLISQFVCDGSRVELMPVQASSYGKEETAGPVLSARA